MADDLTLHHRAVDHPGSITCSHCGAEVALPKTEPWLMVNGEAVPPGSLESLRCSACRGRIYLQPVDEATRERDAELDAREDEDEEQEGSR